jgi:hypothetical protein
MDNEAYGSEVKQDTCAYGDGKYAYDDGVALEVKDNDAYDSSHKTDDYGGGYGYVVTQLLLTQPCLALD